MRIESAAEPAGIDQRDDERDVRAAQRNRAAFSPLYERYLTPVYRYCFLRLGNASAAEDATSATFLKAVSALDRYKSGSFRGWLFTIAHNVVTDHLRTRAREATFDLVMTIADQAAGPAEAVVRADEERRLFEALQQLPADQRRVIELRLAGLSGGEIASVLGKKRNAVDALQFRAVQRLRILMGAHQATGARDER